MENVVAFIAVEYILTLITMENVVAFIASERIVTLTADEGVVAGVAPQSVIAGVAIYQSIQLTHTERISIGRTA